MSMRIVFLNLLAASLLMMFSALAESKQDESLVLYLSFDEGKGNVTNDLSQYKNNGSMQGNAKWVDGKSGKALLFDGSNHVGVPHNDTLNLEGAHTISYWLKWNGVGASWSPFISKTAGQAADQYHTWVGSDHVWDYENTNGQIHGKTLIPLDNEWIFLTVTHDGQKTVLFYINGSFDNEQTLPTMKSNDVPFRVGNDGKGNHGAGTIDEISVFNRALKEGEIKNLMEEGIKAFASIASSGKLTTAWGLIKSQE